MFISHYAPKKLATALSYVVDLLAAIPSVIYGLWGGLVLVPAIYPFWNWVAKYLAGFRCSQVRPPILPVPSPPWPWCWQS